VLSFQAPQCLANPLNALPAEVTDLWLGHVEEAAPLYVITPDWFQFAPLVMGPALLGLALAVFVTVKRAQNGATGASIWDSDVLIILLLITAIALTILQVRFAPFTYIFALLILARWTARLYQTGLITGGNNIKYIFGLALSIPMIWAVPGILMEPSAKSSGKSEASANCVSEDVLASLNDAPKGLIVASANMTGPILVHTDHSAVSGNYHRNWEGISTEIKISIAAPDAAYSLLRAHKIDYLFYCQSPDVSLYSEHNPEGLMAKISSGNIPNFLQPISEPSLEDGEAILFEVVRE